MRADIMRMTEAFRNSADQLKLWQGQKLALYVREAREGLAATAEDPEDLSAEELVEALGEEAARVGANVIKGLGDDELIQVFRQEMARRQLTVGGTA